MVLGNPLKPALKMRRALLNVASSDSVAVSLALARWKLVTQQLAADEEKMSMAEAYSTSRARVAALAHWRAFTVQSRRGRELLRVASNHHRILKRKQALRRWRDRAEASATATRKIATAVVHFQQRLQRAFLHRWRAFASVWTVVKDRARAMGNTVSFCREDFEGSIGVVKNSYEQMQGSHQGC